MIRLFSDEYAEQCRNIILRSLDGSPISKDVKLFLKGIYAKKGYLESVAKRNPVFVYLRGDEVLAIASLEGNTLRRLFVNPKSQTQGIGTEMIKYREDIAKRKGYKKLIIHTFENNVEFYKKRGYSIIKPFIFKDAGVEVPTVEMWNV